MSLPQQALEDFLQRAMEIERAYDLDLTHVRTERQSKIKQLVERYCAEHLDDED